MDSIRWQKQVARKNSKYWDTSELLYCFSLRCIGTPPSFFRHVSKGDSFLDFLFANLDIEIVPKWGLLLKERICSDRNKFFSLELTPDETGG